MEKLCLSNGVLVPSHQVTSFQDSYASRIKLSQHLTRQIHCDLNAFKSTEFIRISKLCVICAALSYSDVVGYEISTLECYIQKHSDIHERAKQANSKRKLLKVAKKAEFEESKIIQNLLRIKEKHLPSPFHQPFDFFPTASHTRR